MFYRLSPREGVMTCPICWGRGHLIGTATTTNAACQTCWGRGRILTATLDDSANDLPAGKHKET